MIEYKKIKFSDWRVLKDRSGYYHIETNGNNFYLKDNKRHNTDGAAFINKYKKEYYLDNVCYGNNNTDNGVHYIPSDEYWIRYQKLLAFT